MSNSGDSTLAIAESGQLQLKQDERGKKEEITAPIGAFRGNDIVLRLGIDVTIAVTETPHKVGSDWVMVARGITSRRPAS